MDKPVCLRDRTREVTDHWSDCFAFLYVDATLYQGRCRI
jgi:hypothetical protein